MSSVFVTGANRGIGLGLVRQLLADSSVGTVIATARNVESAKDLKAIDSPKLHIIPLEVSCEDSIAEAVKRVTEIVGDNGLDILINNAGIACIAKLNGEVSKAKLVEQLDVNTITPLLIANKLYPLLKKAAVRKGWAQIANISSRIGSLENATTVKGAMPITLYAISKTALNMLTRRLSVEWKDDNIRATSFCPGWVQTDMGGPTAHQTVEQSTVPLTKLILSLTEEHNGQYLNTSGEKIPW